MLCIPVMTTGPGREGESWCTGARQVLFSLVRQQMSTRPCSWLISCNWILHKGKHACQRWWGIQEGYSLAIPKEDKTGTKTQAYYVAFAHKASPLFNGARRAVLYCTVCSVRRTIMLCLPRLAHFKITEHSTSAAQSKNLYSPYCQLPFYILLNWWLAFKLHHLFIYGRVLLISLAEAAASSSLQKIGALSKSCHCTFRQTIQCCPSCSSVWKTSSLSLSLQIWVHV